MRRSQSRSAPRARRRATTRASSRSPAAARRTRSRTSSGSQDPAVAKDVLLIDWDRNIGADFRPVYTAALDGLGLSYDVFDGGLLAAGNAGPTFAQLQNYRAVVFFTGNNLTSWANAHVNGSFPLQDFLVAGGKLVLTGQDLNTQYAYNQNAGSDFLYGQMAGWLTGREWTTFPACGLTRSDRDFYGATAAANPATARSRPCSRCSERPVT